MTDHAVARIAVLEAEIEKATLELRPLRDSVTTFLGGPAIEHIQRLPIDGYMAELKPGKPAFNYDGLLGAIGEHIDAETRAKIFQADGVCSTCGGTGRVTGKINAVEVNQVSTWKKTVNGRPIADVIAEFKYRAPAVLMVRRKE